jgi:mannose-6-phosphate isomerase-like protein (cupin superfamily)
MTLWSLSGDRAPHGVAVAKMRIQPCPPAPLATLGVNPGREWFTVLTGTARLQLGERTIEIAEGDAAEFSTMTPHAIGCDDEPVEVLTILDRDGERAHLHPEH